MTDVNKEAFHHAWKRFIISLLFLGISVPFFIEWGWMDDRWVDALGWGLILYCVADFFIERYKLILGD